MRSFFQPSISVPHSWFGGRRWLRMAFAPSSPGPETPPNDEEQLLPQTVSKSAFNPSPHISTIIIDVI